MSGTKINNGGPVFPHLEGDQTSFTVGTYGMTLREWLAGQALQGMLAHSTRYKPLQGHQGHWHDAISAEAYQIADAMIVAQSKPPSPNAVQELLAAAKQTLANLIKDIGEPPLLDDEWETAHGDIAELRRVIEQIEGGAA